MKRTLIISIFILTAVCGLNGCKAHKKVDLTGIHTSEAATTAPPKETMTPTTAPAAESSQSEGGEESKATEGNLTAKLNTYQSGEVSIEYPIVTALENSDQEAAVNQLLKNNALSFIKANEVNESKDSLSVKCKVISIDRKQITASYTGDYTPSGAAYPTAVFYTNTVDLNKGSNISFSSYADPYTMAGYVLSDDCKFYHTSSELETELFTFKNTQTIDYYTNLFSHADFSSKTVTADSQTIFPESFSYENQGIIYFSIPVPHALGDYAIISFTPETK